MSTVQPPSGGLVGYSNYNLYDDCENLTGVSVTVDVTEQLVAIPSAPSEAGMQSNGIGFQLNCLPRAGGAIVWQQYIMVVSRTGENLRWGVNNWNTTPADTEGIIDQGGNLATLPSPFAAGYASIPAGYRFEIALNNDASDNIIGATFSMYDQNGAPVFPPETVALTSLTDVNGNQITTAELSPIVDIDLVIVGYANGAATTLVRGAGTITYRATNSLTVLNTFPACTSGVNTAESSDVRYGELNSSASTQIVQTFQVSGRQLPPLLASFQTVDDYQHIYVLGTNTNLWLEQSPFGSPPPTRAQVDGNVYAFQALDNQTVMVLGTDGNLWIEQGPFGTVPPRRVQLDGHVQAMQALNSEEVLVLGNDGKLWLEQGPFGTVPPSRRGRCQCNRLPCGQ